ncbi:MAG: hypothetical protein KDD70_16555 [Bdellovibrionales bacterium]|nr:hypothetical protein [Bdellovibrionales bacterium]
MENFEVIGFQSCGSVRRCCLRESGAVLVELGFTLPLLLLFGFGAVYLGHVFSAESGLLTASAATRIAVTRAQIRPPDPSVLADYPIPAVRDYAVNGNVTPRLEGLLSSPEDLAAAGDLESLYDPLIATVFPDIDPTIAGPQPGTLSDLSEEYLYSMVYSINLLRQTLGNATKVPCIGNMQPGCIRCLPLPEPNDPTNPNVPGFAGIQCEYVPASIFVRSLVGMAGLLGSGNELAFLERVTQSHAGYAYTHGDGS